MVAVAHAGIAFGASSELEGAACELMVAADFAGIVAGGCAKVKV